MIGKVTGVPIQAAKPSGLGKTSNNIGNAEIGFTTQKLYDITDNTSSNVDDSWDNIMYEDDQENNVGETGYYIAGLSPKNIKIFPDQETGEFVAYL